MLDEQIVTGQDSMEEPNLYNINIIKAYLGYLERYHPDVDIDTLLEYAGISRHQLNDTGFWFTQDQADRWYEIAVRMTGNPNIARDAGRFGVLYGPYAIIRDYIVGFVTVAAVCEAAEKISNKWTRGSHLSTRKLGGNKLEMLAVPASEVKEKLYQCENRMGVIEAVAKTITGEFAHIDHLECIHRGGACCRYIISWDVSPSFRWKRIRNYLGLVGIALSMALFFMLPSLMHMLPALLALGCLLMGTSWWVKHLENVELTKNIEDRGKTAELLLEEIKTRYNDALLVQEIGQASAHILAIDELLATVTQIMKKRLDFDRGGIALANPEGARLVYRVGYGYEPALEQLLRQTHLHLDKPESRGPLVVAFKKQTPYLVNDVREILRDLSPRSREMVLSIGARAFICAPIVFEQQSLGVLVVERTTSSKPMSQSEVSLLVGIAQQIAVSINNACSFQKLQTSEERYRELVENANSIIMRLDTEGYITFFNEFAQSFFDYSEKEIIGQPVLGTILPGENPLRKGFLQWLKGIEKDPRKYMNTQTEGNLKNGRHVWIAWTNKPIFDELGNLVEILCIGNDISELKIVEEEKKKLEFELQRAQKMEAIGTLAGGVAHDLNNILSGIVSYPDLLLMKLPEESPLVRPLMTIRKSGEKASAIVQDLLTLARRGVSVSQVVNMNTVITNYLNSSEFEVLASYNPHVTVEPRLDPDLLNTMGSEVHLSKTIMNMVSNAAEAMPKGGKILIITKNTYIDTPVSGYDHVVPGEYAMMTVSDMGIGIEPEDLPRIFEPFYTKKVMGRSGTGLGMAVIWSTVKDHHGYIDVHSVVGEGTRIDIYLPVTRKALTEDQSPPEWKSLRGSETILVVDDVPEQREIATELLREFGYTVECVASGEEAVEFLQQKDVNLLLLDMIMDPGIDGLETYRRILAFKPGQKAVLVSGFTETDKVKQALRLGAGAYVKKPYVLEKIGKAVRKELDRKA